MRPTTRHRNNAGPARSKPFLDGRGVGSDDRTREMTDEFRHDFNKLNRLPPYILSEVTELTRAGRRAGEDIIDLGMGNPDLPTPPHVVEKICEATRDPRNHRYSSSQ